MNTNTLPDEGETFLDRLKRRQAEVAAEATTGSLTNSSLVSKEFGHVASIAMKNTRALLIRSERLRDLEVVDSTVIVPDDQIPNAHNGEKNLSSFVHQYLPEEEWPRYISE